LTTAAVLGFATVAVAAEQQVVAQLLGREFSAIPGVTVGMLVTGAAPELREVGRLGPADAVLFSRKPDSYRWMYVPSADAKGSVTVAIPGAGNGDQRGPRQRFEGFALATSASLSHLGIDDAFTIVEVEVNGGRGSPPGADRFVATKIRQLDGSGMNYPLRPATAISRAKETCSDRGDLKEKLRLRAASVLTQQTGRAPESQPKDVPFQIHAAWDSQAERIEIACVFEAIEAEHTSGEGTTSTEGQRTDKGRTWGFQATVTGGLSFFTTKDGKLTPPKELPIVPDIREILPPPAAPSARP
jgi:hypothetical protein